MLLSHRRATYRSIYGLVVFRSPSRRLPEFLLHRQLANSSGTICNKWQCGSPKYYGLTCPNTPHHIPHAQQIHPFL